MLKVELIGNIGADAEIKDFQGNKFVTFKGGYEYRVDDELNLKRISK